MSTLLFPPHREWMRRIRDQFGLDLFVESGTFQGDSAAIAAEIFKRVVTIEVRQDFYERARARWAEKHTNIAFRLGDSREMLYESLTEPAFLWLDAHKVAGEFDQAEDECPLIEELDAVFSSGHRHFLLIDDARDFYSPQPHPNYPLIAEIDEKIAAAGYAYLVQDNALYVVPGRHADWLPQPSKVKPQGKAKWCGLVRLGGIGDDLIAASVCKPLHDQGYKVEVITEEPAGVVFENNPWIDKLSIRKNGDLGIDNPAEWLLFWRRLAPQYDLLVNLSHTVETLCDLFADSTAATWPVAARRKLFARSHLETAHDVVGVPHDFGPLFFPTEEEADLARATRANVGGRRVVGWIVAGTRLDKIYPYAPEAVARLIRELDANVVMFGAGRQQFDLAKAIQEHVVKQNGSDRGLHLALSPDADQPSWPIRRSLSFLTRGCDLVIGPDTGSSWAVALEEVPQILLLSHITELMTKHWRNTTVLKADQRRVPCAPCMLLHNDISTCVPNKENSGAACISDITIAAIIEAARMWLNHRWHAERLIAQPMTSEDLIAACRMRATFHQELPEAAE